MNDENQQSPQDEHQQPDLLTPENTGTARDTPLPPDDAPGNDPLMSNAEQPAPETNPAMDPNPETKPDVDDPAGHQTDEPVKQLDPDAPPPASPAPTGAYGTYGAGITPQPNAPLSEDHATQNALASSTAAQVLAADGPTSSAVGADAAPDPIASKSLVSTVEADVHVDFVQWLHSELDRFQQWINQGKTIVLDDLKNLKARVEGHLNDTTEEKDEPAETKDEDPVAPKE